MVEVKRTDTDHYPIFTIQDKDKTSTVYSVKPLPFNYSLFEIHVNKGKLPNILKGYWTKPEAAIKHITHFLDTRYVRPEYRARRRKDVEEENAELQDTI
jgi:hypothetical protein